MRGDEAHFGELGWVPVKACERRVLASWERGQQRKGTFWDERGDEGS